MNRLMFGWELLCCLLATMLVAAAQDTQDEIPLELIVVHHNQVIVEATEAGIMHFQTTGNDPYVEFDLAPGLPAELDLAAALPDRSVLAFEYFSTSGVGGMEVRLRDRGSWEPPLDVGGLLTAQTWTAGGLSLLEPGNEFWKSGRARRLRIDLGQAPGHSLSLRNVCLRPPTLGEVEAKRAAELEWGRKLEIAERWDAYLSDLFPRFIRQVIVDDDQVSITGNLPPSFITSQSKRDEAKRLLLVELEPHAASALVGAHHVVVEFDGKSLEGDNGNFEIRVPRWRDGYDRLLSRWQIAVPADSEQYQPVSTAVYATELLVSRSNDLAAPPTLRNAKGLGGISPVFGLEELVELGIKHITVNMVITDLLASQEISNAPMFEYAGQKWWVREGMLAHVDQTVAFASEYGIVVAAIVLLPQRSTDIIVHPESTSSGVYAMPNLVDRTAALKYAACMRLLSERYAGGPRGRIDHWIMHNEVDFGWIWTNMGQQPMQLFMDHYVRSMRLAALQAQSFNPHAQVFISLTHHWNVADDSRGRTYAPRRMLDWLAQATLAEGEFPWGVAYHPYPENLFNPRTWDDPSATDDEDTRLITMKNLQVLKRYLQQPRLLNINGMQRNVLLSEQGYHTADYSQESQQLQSEAIRYTWKRLRETDFVLAYDYHRWVDAREEGGLLLGLRMVGEAAHLAGRRKLGWMTYRDIDTEAESAE
jgi:hypothetical protein